MNNNKKIIIALGIFFSAILVGLSIINIAINFMYPGNELSDSIKENFKDSFGKSIKFDSLVFKYNGDIILQNFYLSNTTDFNDNVNLIKCNEVVIDTYLFDLLRKKITFSAVIMYKPDINIIKNYGKSYTDTFINDIGAGIKKDKISQFITKTFSIELVDSRLFYREIFKKAKTSIDFKNVDIDIDYDGNEIDYDLDGKIVNDNISRWRKCRFNAEGTYSIEQSRSENNLEFVNIDISLLNNLLAENYSEPFSFKGEFSGEIALTTDNDKINIIAELEGNKIFAEKVSNGETGQILKNENIIIETEIFTTSSMEQVNIKKLTVDDDIYNLSISSEYLKDNSLYLEIKSNQIDLSDLSYKFIPFKKYRYEGNLSLNGKLKYNLKDMKPDDLAIDVKLNQFSFIPADTSNSMFNMIKNCNAIIAVDKEKYIVKTKFDTGNTDLDISFSGQIFEWNPFKSSNRLDVISQKMELSLIKTAVLAGINAIYNMAYVDMFQNFDEQKNFLKEPEGIFLNNNNLNLNLKAAKVIIKQNASLSNLNIAINLDKGNLKTDNFALEGYEGIFNFNAYATLRQDYPFIKIEGSVENLNISQIAAESDSEIKAGGIFSSDFRFETNAFRIGQIVENGRAAFNINIKDGYIAENTDIKTLNDFIKNNGYSEYIPEPLTFNSLTFTFMQSANEFYIRNFSLTGNKCSFSSYGKYTEEEGLSIPLNLNINVNNNYSKVPLIIYGNLMSPCIRINEKKKNDSICF